MDPVSEDFEILDQKIGEAIARVVAKQETEGIPSHLADQMRAFARELKDMAAQFRPDPSEEPRPSPEEAEKLAAAKQAEAEARAAAQRAALEQELAVPGKASQRFAAEHTPENIAEAIALLLKGTGAPKKKGRLNRHHRRSLAGVATVRRGLGREGERATRKRNGCWAHCEKAATERDRRQDLMELNCLLGDENYRPVGVANIRQIPIMRCKPLTASGTSCSVNFFPSVTLGGAGASFASAGIGLGTNIQATTVGINRWARVFMGAPAQKSNIPQHRKTA